MRRRGLGDVLHYFIPEDEQREARAQAQAAQTRLPASAIVWCLPASAERLLSCALAIDLAVAAARDGARAEILAPFPRHRLLPRAPEVSWQEIDLADAGAEGLERSLQQRPPGTRSFVLLPPAALGTLLQQLAPGSVYGVLVPLEATPLGPGQALGLLRQLGPLMPELRVGAVRVGAVRVGANGRAEGQDMLAFLRNAGTFGETVGEV